MTISGWDVVWALKRSLTIPLAHVVGAKVESVAGKPGWKIAGTDIPRGFSAGWFRRQGRNEFWVARQTAEVVVIELRDEKYARLVLVDDPQRSPTGQRRNRLIRLTESAGCSHRRPANTSWTQV